MKLLSLFFLTVVCLLLAAPLFAQTPATTDYPLLDVRRASIAAGLDYVGYQQTTASPAATFKNTWEVAGYGAYVLTPHVTGTVSLAYDWRNSLVRYRVGVRTVLWKGASQ